MTDEPTAADIEQAYPNWETWEGTDQMCHGRRTSGAALTRRGEDWADLLDQIRHAELMLEDTPEAWRKPGG